MTGRRPVSQFEKYAKAAKESIEVAIESDATEDAQLRFATIAVAEATLALAYATLAASRSTRYEGVEE